MGPSSIVTFISCVLTLEIFMTLLFFLYAIRPQNSIVLPIFSRVFDSPLVVKNDGFSRSNFGKLQAVELLIFKVSKKKQTNI